MPDIIKARNANDAWLQARRKLLTAPGAINIASRSGPTTELLHVAMSIRDPRQRWVFARQPVVSPAFALAEAVWILAGRNDSAVLNFFNRDLPKYAGRGPAFYGAYGFRLRHQHGIDQLNAAYDALRSNPGSRQVVLQIWDAKADLPDSKGEPRSADIPCNTQALLRIQGGKLHWLQIMRSNDLYRGLPYNFVQFTTLQEVVAGWLGVGVGAYTHVVSSLHFYQSDLQRLQYCSRRAPIENTDRLSCTKGESDRAFGILSNLITDLASSASRTRRAAARLDRAALPESYANIGNVILAEAGRRSTNWRLAEERAARITNPCLRTLLDNWFSRFESEQKKRFIIESN